MFASSAVYRNDSFAKLVGSDFFNTLSHKRKLVRPEDAELWSITTLHE